jgi:hypothetical protein
MKTRIFKDRDGVSRIDMGLSKPRRFVYILHCCAADQRRAKRQGQGRINALVYFVVSAIKQTWACWGR